MTDQELLKMAAKAAGAKSINCPRFTSHRWIIEKAPRYWVGWNPLEDDGDALRLAVKLGMEVYIDTHPEGCECTEVKTFAPHPDWIIINHDGDPLAATRRAIVRAAAAIGEKT